MKQFYIFLTLLFIVSQFSFSQNYIPVNDPVYYDAEVPRIDIYLAEDSLIELYQYENLESDHEYPAMFIYTSSLICDTFPQVGFRLRGNTSRYSQKKSFKVSFNSFSSTEFYDLDNLNLNGEHNDPSIIRSKLNGDILRLIHIPAARTNHVALYINDDYFGLYINVEHIDDNFLEKRYTRSFGNLYKCYWSGNLQYISNNPDDYKFTNDDGRRIYELKTNEDINDYSDLSNFIDMLNNTPVNDFPTNLEPIFNVNLYLKTLAFEILTGHWDGYAFNQNNYYLYHNPTTNRFEYIPYDMDNTFGIDWFNIDWTTRDIYNWAENGRPLANRLLENDEYRNRFSFYINLIIADVLNTTNFFPRIDVLKDMITPYAEADYFRTLDYGFTIDDFNNSYIQALGDHVKTGLKPFISERNASALSQLDLQTVSPLISIIDYGFLSENSPFNSEVFVEDDGSITSAVFHYSLDEGTWNTINMNDDGINGDTLANDGTYSVLTEQLSGVMRIDFYYEITDDDGNVTREPYQGNYTVTRPQHSDLTIVINEFMADNETTISDESGAFEDWLELYNYGDEAIFLGNIYLTDDFLNPGMWRLPDVHLQAGDFLLIWTDSDPEEGSLHTNFKLSKSGEQVGVFLKNGNEFLVVDSMNFGAQQTDISWGCGTDASPNYIFFSSPTPGYSNNLSATPEIIAQVQLCVYPNPASNFLNVDVQNSNIEKIYIYDINGRQIYADNNTVIDVSNYSEGVYFISVVVDDFYGKKIINGKFVVKN